MGEGSTVAEASRKLGMTEQTVYRLLNRIGVKVILANGGDSAPI